MDRLAITIRTALCALLGLELAACVAAPVATPGLGALVTKTGPTEPNLAAIGGPLTPTPPPAAASTPTPMPTALPGRTPTPMTPPPAVPPEELGFRSVSMIDPPVGWGMAHLASSDSVRIVRTGDGGETWTDVSPSEGNFYQAFFLDALTAWAVTGVGWRTLDGGRTWEMLEEFGPLSDFAFVDSLRGWKMDATEWGLSFRQFEIDSFQTTQDGGLTWQHAEAYPPTYGVTWLAFPSAEMAWAISAGFAKTIGGVPNLHVPFRVVATFDRAISWVTRQVPLPPDAELIEQRNTGTYLAGVGNCDIVSPVYSSTAIWKAAVTCEGGAWLYTSANQGKTWIISEMPAGQLPDMHFVNPTVGWMLVTDLHQQDQGLLYHTPNGGQSWHVIKRTGWTGLQMSFLDEQTGWAVASSCPRDICAWYEQVTALVKTIDGGQTWEMMEPRLTQ